MGITEIFQVQIRRCRFGCEAQLQAVQKGQEAGQQLLLKHGDQMGKAKY